ncbi:MAG: TRAP transporter small permease [Albidovulum sp.]|nr:TRAP transporter small permease [Albidovulum sp.]
MESSGSSPEGGLSAKADIVVRRIESSLNILSGIVIFALVLLASINVLARKFLNSPVPGYIDWTEQFMAVFAFFGIAYCQCQGSHIRMDFLVARLKGRQLWFAELLGIALMLLITTVLIIGSWFHFLRSLDFGSAWWSRDSSIDVALPLWPAKLIVPLALSLLWLRLALQMRAFWIAFLKNAETAFGTPVVLDPASQAAQEADAMRGAENG